LLAPALTDDESNVCDDAESIGLVASKAAFPNGTLEEDVDEKLAPLLEQLRSHVESMHGNGLQVAGVADAIMGAQASLDCALARCGSLQSG